MKRILIILATVLLTVGVAFGNPNVSTETGNSQNINREDGESSRTSDESRQSDSDSTSTSTGTGIDKQWQDAVREMEQQQNSANFDITMSLDSLFRPRIVQLEREGKLEPFKSCQLMSRPQQARDFGITAMIETNWVDTAKSQALEGLAKANGPVDEFGSTAKLLQKKNCMLIYGGFISQAYQNIEAAMSKLASAKVPPEPAEPQKKNGKKSKKGKQQPTAKASNSSFETLKIVEEGQGGKKILGLSSEEYQAIVDEALDMVVKQGRKGIKEKRLNSIIDKAYADKSRCYFDGSVEKILCGSNLIIIGGQPQLFTGGLEFYGHSFGGFSGTFRLSSAVSLSKNFEKMASTSKYQKQAKEISKRIEKMKSSGEAYEATMATKVAIDQMKSGRKSLDLSGFISSLKGN